MRHYIGERGPDGCKVEVLDRDTPGGGYELPLRLDLRSHSPSGFSWGYSGSGPAQLSLALLADALQDTDRAQRHYQEFKRKVIARIDSDRFELSQEDILQTVLQIEAERGMGR